MPLSPLAKLLSDSIERTLEPRTAIAFSGGLDSSTLAAVAKKKADVQLITISSSEGSQDLQMAQEVASELGLPLTVVSLTPSMLTEDFRACWSVLPGSAVEMELMAGIWECAKAAHSLQCPVMLTGSGAEELFVGYSKYYQALSRGMDLQAILDEELSTLPRRDIMRAKIICARHGVVARFPFLDERLVEAVRAVPLSEKLDDGVAKKPLLRKLAVELGVPKLAVERPKKAMQYGSGLHKMMERLVKEGKIPKLPSRVPEWMKEKEE